MALCTTPNIPSPLRALQKAEAAFFNVSRGNFNANKSKTWKQAVAVTMPNVNHDAAGMIFVIAKIAIQSGMNAAPNLAQLTTSAANICTAPVINPVVGKLKPKLPVWQIATKSSF